MTHSHSPRPALRPHIAIELIDDPLKVRSAEMRRSFEARESAVRVLGRPVRVEEIAEDVRRHVLALGGDVRVDVEREVAVFVCEVRGSV